MNKVIIYQIFTRLFGNRNTSRIEHGTIAENGCGKFADIDEDCLKKIKKLGVSHVWYTGVIRHATQTDYSDYGLPTQHPGVVKGKAGSPYAITDYYDIDPDLSIDVPHRMEEFEQLVARTHRAGLKLIIDFVPNHVARQYCSVAKPAGVIDLGADDDKSKGFDAQNNFYYCPQHHLQPSFETALGAMRAYEEFPAKATGNDHFDPWPGQNDWYETVKLNYGVDYYAGRVGHFDPIPNTWMKMVDILLFWAAKGIDGFRCDMAEMVPAEFWAWATQQVKTLYPALVFIGEVYNPSEYRHYIASGFDYLYDKVGMYDTLKSVMVHGTHPSAITHSWQAVEDIADHMLYFLENHDEQRIASSFFAGDARKGVPALIVSTLLRSNPFMLYAGEEYGEKGMDKEGFSGVDGRTTIFDYWNIDTLCRASWKSLTDEEKALYDLHVKVLNIAQKEKAVTQGQFFDLMYVNGQLSHQYAFLRKAGNDLLLIVANFEDAPVRCAVNLPQHAFDYLALPEKKVVATDLLSGVNYDCLLSPEEAVKVDLSPCSGVVLKMSVARPRKTKKDGRATVE